MANFSGVDQTDPLDDFVYAVGTEADAINVDVPTDVNDVVFDNIFLGSAPTLPSLIVGTDQSEQWNETIDRARGAASIETASGSTTSMSWTASGGATAYYWSLGAVPINPAPAAEPIVVASATASDHAPTVGDTVDVTISFDMSGMPAPDDHLGSFTSTFSWNPAVLAYNSDSGLLNGFTGAINPDSGEITFNGAQATGPTGSFDVFIITFDVIGEGNAGFYSYHSRLLLLIQIIPFRLT